MMLKVAPTLIVERIEPSLEFLTARVGFEKVAEVPGDSGLVFAMLVHGSVEIHLQTRASVTQPYLAACSLPPASFLYLDVADVHALWEQLKDCEILTPLEKTFYGATHFFLKEPGGHVLGFSQNS